MKNETLEKVFVGIATATLRLLSALFLAFVVIACFIFLTGIIPETDGHEVVDIFGAALIGGIMGGFVGTRI